MIKVKFTADACITVDGVSKRLFKEGLTKDLEDASAQRWIRRGVAVDVDAAKKATAAAEQEKADDAAADEAQAKAAAKSKAKSKAAAKKG